MRSVDLAVIALGLLGLILSIRSGGDHTLQEAWWLPLDPSLYSNGHFPLKGEKLPPPIVTDLDGDGRPEIVLVTRVPSVMVLDPLSLSGGTQAAAAAAIAAEGGQRAGSAVAAALANLNNEAFGQPPLPTVLAEASLLPTVRVSAGRQPTAVATGYLDPFVDGKARQQFVCVVLQGWGVMLFDSDLRLIWESHGGEEVPASFYHSSIDILITSKPAHEGDRGMVIVAGRQELDPSERAETLHDHSGTDETSPSQASDEDDDGTLLQTDSLTMHFSYYAFDGRTGRLRWKHEAGDFLSSVPGEDVTSSQHVFDYLQLKADHIGESDWRRFRHDMMAHLPHRWAARDDTRLRLAHFTREPARGRKSRTADAHTEEASGLLGSHVAGLAYGGHSQHSEDEHVDRPNVIVAHTADGIEVVHLYSGRTLTQLTLPQGGAYGDVDGDGVIDRVESVGGLEESESPRMQHLWAPSCFARVTSGIPPIEQLYNGSICDTRGSLGETFMRAAAKTGGRSDHSTLGATLPVLVPRNVRPGASAAQQLNTVHLVSSGRLTSYWPSGRLDWQIMTDAGWPTLSQSRLNPGVDLVGTVFSPHEFIDQALHPSLNVMALQPWSDRDCVLVVGVSSIQIVGPRGHVLASASIKSPPVGAVTIADFSADGWNDVIVTTTEAVIGLKLHHRPGSTLMTALIGGLFLVLIGTIVVRGLSSGALARRAARKRMQK